jgi:multiple sugar transport system substrate-binding protein
VTRRQLLLASSGGLLTGGCLPSSRTDARTTLRYMAWGTPEQLALERALADTFESQNPDVRVHLFIVPGSAYQDKLQLMLASRTAPDVCRVDHYLFPALVKKDYFLCLDPYISQEPTDFLKDFTPIALDECRYQNKIYAMNVLFGGIQLYYNKNIFSQAKLINPMKQFQSGNWSWDSFVEASIKLTKTEDGRIAQFGTTFPPFPMFMSVIWNRGGEFFDKTGTRFILADDPNAVLGMQDLADLRWKHHCAPTPADAALSAFTFESGKIAMHWGWSGETPRFRKNIKNFDWDIAPVPSGPAGNVTVVKGNQLFVNKNTKMPEIAWKFVKFMTGTIAERKLGGELRRCVATRRSVQNDPAYLTSDKPPFQTEVFLDAVKRGRILPIDARYQEWAQVFNSATDALFNVGTLSVRDACQSATDRINALLSGEEGF